MFPLLRRAVSAGTQLSQRGEEGRRGRASVVLWKNWFWLALVVHATVGRVLRDGQSLRDEQLRGLIAYRIPDDVLPLPSFGVRIVLRRVYLLTKPAACSVNMTAPAQLTASLFRKTIGSLLSARIA